MKPKAHLKLRGTWRARTGTGSAPGCGACMWLKAAAAPALRLALRGTCLTPVKPCLAAVRRRPRRLALRGTRRTQWRLSPAAVRTGPPSCPTLACGGPAAPGFVFITSSASRLTPSCDALAHPSVLLDGHQGALLVGSGALAFCRLRVRHLLGPQNHRVLHGLALLTRPRECSSPSCAEEIKSNP